MNQSVITNATKELKFQKTTIVKLNMTKVGQLALSGGTTTHNPQTTKSTAPQCDITTTSVTTII